MEMKKGSVMACLFSMQEFLPVPADEWEGGGLGARRAVVVVVVVGEVVSEGWRVVKAGKPFQLVSVTPLHDEGKFSSSVLFLRRGCMCIMHGPRKHVDGKARG